MASGTGRRERWSVTAPLLHAVFRSRTGRVVDVGACHDVAALEAELGQPPDMREWREGFVVVRTGRFLTRSQAAHLVGLSGFIEPGSG